MPMEAPILTLFCFPSAAESKLVVGGGVEAGLRTVLLFVSDRDKSVANATSMTVEVNVRVLVAVTVTVSLGELAVL